MSVIAAAPSHSYIGGQRALRRRGLMRLTMTDAKTEVACKLAILFVNANWKYIRYRGTLFILERTRMATAHAAPADVTEA